MSTRGRGRVYIEALYKVGIVSFLKWVLVDLETTPKIRSRKADCGKCNACRGQDLVWP